MVSLYSLIARREFQNIRPFFPHHLEEVLVDSVVFLKTVSDLEALEPANKLAVVPFAIFNDSHSEFQDLLATVKAMQPSALGILMDSTEEHFLLSEIANAARYFPILMIPHEIEISDLADEVASMDENSQLLDGNGSFRNFAGILLNGGGVQEILERLSSILTLDICFKDLHKNLTILHAEDDEFIESVKIYPLKEVLRLYLNFPVHHGGKLLGYLVINEEISSGFKLPLNAGSVIEDAIVAVRFVLEKRQNEQRFEKQYRDQFVRDLLYNRISSMDEVINRVQSFGWKLKDGVFALLLNFESDENETAEKVVKARVDPNLFSLVISRMRVFFPSAIYVELSRSIVFIVSSRKGNDSQRRIESLLEVAGNISAEINKADSPGLSISIGGYRDNILLAHESYEEARKALKVLKLYDVGKDVVAWDELGAYKLLSTMATTEEASILCSKQIGKLVNYDEEHNSGLLRTLFALEKNNWNLSSTSADLRIHYNTMKYRYKKIADILSVNIDDSEKRFNIALSLRLFKIISA